MAEKRTGSLATSLQVPGLRQALIDTEAAMPSFRRPGDEEAHRARRAERYSHGEPIYCTRMPMRFAGFDVAGDPHEWLQVDADDNVTIAPTDHLSEDARRCHTYYPPPDGSEAQRG